jgi:SnoaL-like domain
MTFDLRSFADHYTAAWCSQNAASVAVCYSPNGSLTINDGPPSVGRAAVTATAQEFMTSFPDLKVTMDSVSAEGGGAIYRWTLDGTNNGPGGTGAHVHISGFEEWFIGDDGLIAKSLGHFDSADWQRQIGR